MKSKLIVGIILAISMLTIPVTAVFAQDPFNDVCQGQAVDSSVCNARNTTENPLLGADGILTRVVQILIAITAVIAVIMIMVGGFKYIISTGDSGKVNNAKDTILYAVIGLVVAVLGQTIVTFVLKKL